ncbi:DNA protecting protein DprA [Rhodoferax koreense]|uniref:DNA protecting protein DprA n=1 Tax=Rhodoferax koreensis TaxID=1842727 RepID=A0A1P8K2L2_9BURK|nr:DNA-processing protein DprA [Rhodoferax koreense]APW40239.1 DNA protecting protein DprA [Rhodoferax koreense]
MERDELECWLRLSLSEGIGNISARRLLAAFGLPQDIFTQSATALRQVVTPAQAAALLSPPKDFQAQLEATGSWLQGGSAASGWRAVVALGDAAYPSSLLAMEDPPLMLYALGRTDLLAGLDAAHCLAMVGSRNPTPQGEVTARDLARGCAEAGLCIVSGLALGIDSAAHDGALLGAAAGADRLATIAIVGTGLDRVYPKRNLALAHRIAAQGLLLSEYPLGTPPLAENFPRRNRIIAGLSMGTLVVEAALKSGSLITARLALEQGKDVFAVPGSIHAMQSRGCHALIKQGAKLVENIQDVLDEIRPSHARAAAQSADSDEPDDPFLVRMGHDPISLDALVARTGISAAELQVRLLELELEHQVARLPGGLFQRTVAA